MEFQLTVFLALVATGVHSGPLQVQQPISTCSRECTGRSNFQYSPGSTYTYSYEVETKTAILGATEDQSTIKIRATANIEVLSKCEMLLQLRDVSIESSDPSLPLRLKAGKTSSDFSAVLQQHPLRFSFQDGEVNEICPEDDESSWVLNIKRGLLSAFQNTMDDLDMDRYKARENDVMGNCPTEYVLTQKGWKAKNIRKTKDFLACMDRQSYESSIRSVPLKLASNLRSLPLLKSTILCEQTIASSGQLKEVQCHETHMFRPFSKENSGAATEITQKLTLIRETSTVSSTEKDLISRRSNLLFEHTHGEIPATAGVLDAKNKLEEICKSTEQDIRSETPQDFAELVYIMKKMDKSSLRSLFTEIKEPFFCPNNADRTQKFFRDALPMLGTEGAIGLMQEMIRSNEVSGVEAEMWLMSLAFIHHPTREILVEVQNLLGLPSLSSKAFLPLSTLVHTFCQANPNCEGETAVQSVVSLITEKIGSRCLVNNNHQTVMLALRAIGNIGHAQTSIPTLYSCISNTKNPMDIRVAAVEAFRRMSCGADRNNLMALFRNSGEDSELRIAAYLAAMKCPSKYIISQVHSTLATEEVNQVSSFVWTHLTNLQESSDSANQEVKAMLRDVIFEKEFDMDKRKFSRNYEASFFLEKLGTGAKIDSNLVWSAKSFIPRSASMNLTFDLFGSSINLFEVGGRVQGLEYLLESYFGPAGYFKNPAKTQGPQTQGIKSKDIQSEKINDINGKLDSSMDDLRAALYTRVFGNELNYVTLGSKASQDDDFGSFNLPEFISKLRQNVPQEMSLTKSIMLIDTTLVIPTGVGLPLNLTLNATASMALKVSGQMNLVKPSTSVVLEGSLAPSGAIAVSSIMSIDATVVRGGLKMVSTLHSSTGGKVKVELKKKQLFNLQLDLAQDKMEILDVKTKFFIFFDNIHKEQKMHTTDYSYKQCTSERAARVIGLEICTASFVPKEKMATSPYFPLSGPAGYSIIVSKKDLPAGFVLEAKTVDTPSQTIIRFMANTPSSVVDRALGLDIVVDHAQKTLDASLATPWKRADFSGSFQNTQDLKALTGKLTLDRIKEYVMDHQLKISRKNDRLTFSPTSIIKIPDWKDLSLTGNIDYLKMKNFTADLSLQGAFKDPVLLTTSVLNTDIWVGAKGEFTHEGDQV
uniref:Apolipophorin n=1 Tax=Sinohyriopsis cumingii TaxID=165450 RepID=R4VDM5_SINCU|nr:apolipophorin [Sinohyriopsis cumingii]